MINNFSLIKRRSPQHSLGSKEILVLAAVLSVYWRENLGQATLEHNAEIIKLKHFLFISLAWHLHREVRTKGYLHSNRNGLSILLKGINECMLLQGTSVQAPSFTVPTCCLKIYVKKQVSARISTLDWSI